MFFQDLLPSSMVSRCKFSGLFLGHASLRSQADDIWQKKSLKDADSNRHDRLK